LSEEVDELGEHGQGQEQGQEQEQEQEQGEQGNDHDLGYESEEDDEGISEVDEAASALMDLHQYFLTNFERNPIPKQHFMAYHATDFLLQHLSLGMFAEQGVESAHAIFNTTWRTFKSQKNKGELAIARFNTFHENEQRYNIKRRKRATSETQPRKKAKAN